MEIKGAYSMFGHSQRQTGIQSGVEIQLDMSAVGIYAKLKSASMPGRCIYIERLLTLLVSILAGAFTCSSPSCGQQHQ